MAPVMRVREGGCFLLRPRAAQKDVGEESEEEALLSESSTASEALVSGDILTAHPVAPAKF